MCLNAIIAHYHAVLLCPRVRTALIWNFDLHVNVVNFHIIKIHKSNTIGRPGIRARARAHVCMRGLQASAGMDSCLFVYAHAITFLYMCVLACKNMLYANVFACVCACVCVCLCMFVRMCMCLCGDRGGFGVEIMHWGLMCNYWNISGISGRSQ